MFLWSEILEFEAKILSLNFDIIIQNKYKMLFFLIFLYFFVNNFGRNIKKL